MSQDLSKTSLQVQLRNTKTERVPQSSSKIQGNVSARISLVAVDSRSGNLMSKATSKSPFLVGSLGNGSPYPGNLLTVCGFTISPCRFTVSFSPVMVGTSMTVPHNACNNGKLRSVSTGSNTCEVTINHFVSPQCFDRQFVVLM